MLLRTSLLALVAFALAPDVARAAESYDSCVGYIDSLPATLSTPGTWCLRKDLSTAVATGAAITIASSHVAVDCNGFKLGNLPAGMATGASGIYSRNTLDVGVRRCNIRGFLTGVDLVGGASGGAYLVEDNLLQGATSVGIRVEGDGSTIRGNTVSDTGGTTLVADAPRAILTVKTVDIVDNAITGVYGQQSEYGIHFSNNSGGAVRGNRVRGFEPVVGFESVGIHGAASYRVAVRNNDVFAAWATSGTVGIRCPSGTVRARGNIVRGFTTGLQSCGNAGRNDVTP